MRYYRPTWAEVNLENLAFNFRKIKKLISAGTKVMVTVKADAYGHGLIKVARKLVSCGADYFGVASIDEGILLRQANIKLPILVLGAVLKKDVGPLLKYDLTATAGAQDFAVALNKGAKQRGRAANVHVKVDTGMGRIGVLHQDAAALVQKMHKLKFINIEGIFTHFAFADMEGGFTLYQIDLFEKLIARLEQAGIHIPLVHAANSMGAIGYKRAHFNMIRPGLVIYGLYPKKNISIKLKPVLSLKTKIIYHKAVPAGCGISYGHTYVTKKPTTIATLPIGYGDGYPRSLSNLAPVLIKGRRLRIIGNVCMDQMMVDVGNLKVKAGDEAVLIGSQGKNRISAEELAGLCGTIPYEIVCGIGSRVPRVYI